MENWELRKAQSARIVGTTDSYRLRAVTDTARSHIARQRSAVPRGGPARWQSVGPDNVPGRIGALAISQQDGQILYAGSAAGGVYKTTDGGANWDPLWSDQRSLAVGGLAVAPTNHDIVYVATGEWEGNVSSTPYHHFPGVGVYRTTNGGCDWTPSPIPSMWTAAVAVDPQNPDRVFVAGDRALHRSRDGGVSWDTAPANVCGVFCGTISDVAIDPEDPRRVYIGAHRSGIWRSADGGDAWVQLTLPGIPDADVVSPKLALCRRPGRLPIVAVLTSGSVFTSQDGGDTFIQMDSIRTASYAAWCTTIAIDPADPSVLLAGHVSLWRSDHGGRGWKVVGADVNAMPRSDGHADEQAIVFDPHDHAHVYVATDGGVFESHDNGKTWSKRSRGLVTTQCYTVALSRTNSLRIGITTQDNGVYQSDGRPTFDELVKDEGGWIEYDPKNESEIYADTRHAPMMKSTNAGGTWTLLGVESDAAIREALAIARTNPQWLLVVDCCGRVLRSTNAGGVWTTALAPPGVTLCAVEYSPRDENWAYAVSTLGRVWFSTNGGAVWQELLSTDGILPQRPVNDIEVDSHDPRRVFLAFGDGDVTFGSDTRAVWRGDVTLPAKVTWTDVCGRTPAESLPPRLPITALALDPNAPDTLYAAHLLGVHRSTDGGASWVRFDEGLPQCFVSDLDVHEPTRTLYLATMGRGLYRWTL